MSREVTAPSLIVVDPDEDAIEKEERFKLKMRAL